MWVRNIHVWTETGLMYVFEYFITFWHHVDGVACSFSTNDLIDADTHNNLNLATVKWNLYVFYECPLQDLTTVSQLRHLSLYSDWQCNCACIYMYMHLRQYLLTVYFVISCLGSEHTRAKRCGDARETWLHVKSTQVLQPAKQKRREVHKVATSSWKWVAVTCRYYATWCHFTKNLNCSNFCMFLWQSFWEK